MHACVPACTCVCICPCQKVHITMGTQIWTVGDSSEANICSGLGIDRWAYLGQGRATLKAGRMFEASTSHACPIAIAEKADHGTDSTTLQSANLRETGATKIDPCSSASIIDRYHARPRVPNIPGSSIRPSHCRTATRATLLPSQTVTPLNSISCEVPHEAERHMTPPKSN